MKAEEYYYINSVHCRLAKNQKNEILAAYIKSDEGEVVHGSNLDKLFDSYKKKVEELNEMFPCRARLTIFEYILEYGSRHVRNITIKHEKSGAVGGAEPYLQISLIPIKGEIVPVP